MALGGKRKGAGRKKGEPTKVLRVPESLVSDLKIIIQAHKDKVLELRKKGSQFCYYISSESHVNIDSSAETHKDQIDLFQETAKVNEICEWELKQLPRHERRRAQKEISKGRLKLVDLKPFEETNG